MCKAKLGAAPLSKGPATSSARFYDSSDESDAHQPGAQPCSAPVYRKRSQEAVQLASQIPLETRAGIKSGQFESIQWSRFERHRTKCSLHLVWVCVSQFRGVTARESRFVLRPFVLAKGRCELSAPPLFLQMDQH